MKRFFLNILSVTLLSLYLLSTMGVGVHVCSHDGSRNLIVLYGESPCNHLHSHIDKSGRIYTHSHFSSESEQEEIHQKCGCGEYKHGDHCCKTFVFVLSHDQINSHNSHSLDHLPLTVLSSHLASQRIALPLLEGGHNCLSLQGERDASNIERLRDLQELKIQFRV